MKIAFGYKMRVGKDTAVEYLKSIYDGFHVKFSSPLYSIMSYAQSVCRFKDEKDRKFLQWIGTDWAREKEPDVWVRLFFETIESISKEDNIYCSDVRFINEFNALKKAGWTCIKIIGKNEEDTVATRHESENQLDSIPNEEWDFVVKNKGTLEEFYCELDHIVSLIQK